MLKRATASYFNTTSAFDRVKFKFKRQSLAWCVGITLAMSAGAHADGDASNGPGGSDSFGTAGELTGQFMQTEPTNVSTFSIENGEPHHGNGVDPTAGKSAWWKWTAPTTGWCTLSTEETGYLNDPLQHTCIGIYTGSDLTTLQKVGGALAIDSVLGNRFSKTSFLAQAGTIYHIAVDGGSNSVGIGSRVVLTLRQYVPEIATLGASTWVHIPASNGGGTLPASLTLTSTATGRVTGKLTTPVKTWSFTGVFGIDGILHTNFDMPMVKGQPQEPPVQMTLNAMSFMQLFYKGGTSRGVLTKQIRPSGSARPAAGLYNLSSLLEGLQPDSLGGYAFVQMRVKATGSVSLAYTLADGTAVTQGTWLYDAGSGTSFGTNGLVMLYKKKGWLLMSAAVSSPQSGPSTAGISFLQHRPANFAKDSYQHGFEEYIVLYGRLYQPPARGSLPLDFLAKEAGACHHILEADGEEFPGPNNRYESFTLNTSGRFVSDFRLGSVLSMNVKTGLVSGSLTDPDGIKRKLKGLLFRDLTGEAFILGQATGRFKTLRWSIEPLSGR